MTLPTLIARLERDGWTPTGIVAGTRGFISADNELALEVGPGEDWLLGEFTDSDVAGVATGRYQTVDEGDSLREIPEAIRCAIAGVEREVEDDEVYEYAEQKGSYAREEGEE